MSFTRLFLLSTLLLCSISEIYGQEKRDPLEDSIAFYQAKKNYPKLISFAEARRRNIKKKKGEASVEYAIIQQILGDALRRNGQTTEATPVLLECLEIRRKIFGENHPDVASTLYSLGGLYTRLSDYPKAEESYRKALEIRKNTLGENHLEVSNSYYGMAYLQARMGNYTDAEEFYLKSLEISRKLNGEEDISLANSLNGLGALYNDWGKYPEAEASFLRAIDIWKKALGENHIDIANTYNNLGNLYEKMGNYSNAQRYFLKSLEIWKTAYGESNPDVADGYNNLGVMHLEKKNYPNAEEYLLKSLEIRRQILGDSNSDLAPVYLNIGTLYFVTGKYPEAKKMYLASLHLARKSVRENHPDLADLYNNLAGVFMRMADNEKAESYFQKSLSIFQNTLGELHPQVVASYNRLGQVNFQIGNLPMAEHYHRLFQQRELELFRRYFPYLSDGEKEKYVERERLYLDAFKSFCQERYASNPSIAGDLYNQQLATKAILLSNSAKWRKQIKSSGDAETINMFENWNQTQSRLNDLFQSYDSIARLGIDSIQRKAERLEKELSLRSENITKRTDREQVVWQEVQKKLRKNEAAIEIIRSWKFGVQKTFTDSTDPKKPTYKVNGLTDTIFYVALIIKPDSRYPEMVVLKNGNDLEAKCLKQYKGCINRRIPDKDSYRNFWEKIGSRLGSTRTIYVSADGVYHKINLNTLQNPQTGKYVLDELDIRMVTVTKDIVNPQNGKQDTKIAELVGFPTFYKKDSDTTRMEAKWKIKGYWPENRKLEELPSTKLEVERIGKLLTSKGWLVRSSMGEKATEENLCKISQPKLLHIATHGFFQADTSGDSKPLVKSGLILAGAGSYHENEKSGSADNGILTSAEAMNLNLDNTDLVVLSACETGLGDVKNGEGVYGLQRAFKVAGAQSIIMSLWKVSDDATQELMVGFYRNWLTPKNSGGGMSKRTAFLTSQRALKRKYPDPFYWGAFVMLGE